MREMSKAQMLKLYKAYTAAEGYMVGFSYKGMGYGKLLKNIPEQMIEVWHESSKKGGSAKLQMVTRKADKEKMVRGAICFGSTDILEDDTYNKGVMFEKVVSEYYGVEFRGKDSEPFYKGGDLEINGKQIQIKFERAQIVTEKTLIRLENGTIVL